MALDFDRSSDYVVMSGISISDLNEWTIGFWMCVPAFSGTQLGIMAQANAAPNEGFGIFADNAGARVYTIGIYAPAGNIDLISPNNSVVVNTWAHFAFVHSVSGGYTRIYKNGAQIANTGNTTIIASTEDFWVGGIWKGAYNQWFYGKLDEIHVWNTALSIDRISNDMIGRIPAQTNLLGMWRLDEGALNLAPGGVDCTDLSGNGYHGTAGASMTDADYVAGAPIQWNQGD